MKDSLLEKYKLQKRIEVLESLIIEKSVGRGGEPSNAMKVWQLLTDNGPMTRQQIQSSGLSATATAGASLNFYVDHDLLTKIGDRFAANPDYRWDDIGVIPRTAQQELMNSVRNAPNIDGAPLDEVPAKRTRGRRGTAETPAEEQPTRRGRQIREPIVSRTREIKQDLFSRKYEEVKAAIDAGQDCKAINDKGITPLVYACRDTKGQSGQIVELLLDNGANANDLDGNKYVIFNAIKNSNFEAVKALVEHGADLKVIFKKVIPIEYAFEVCEINDHTMETISLLTNDKLGGQSRTFYAAVRAVANGKIGAKWYSELINKTYISSESVMWIANSDRIYSELYTGVSTIYDKYIKLTGKMPPLSGYSAQVLIEYGNKFAIDKLYNTVKDVVAGKIKPYSIDNLFAIYESLGRNIEGISNFVTTEYIIEHSKTSSGINDLMSAIRYAISKRDIRLLQTIAKSKIRVLNGDDIISYIANNARDDKAVTAAALRIVNNCANTKNGFNGYSALRIAKSTNDYLIDWAIDKGFGQSLIDAQSHGVPISPYCIKALEDAGFDVSKLTPIADRNARDEYKMIKDYIIRLIKNDEWTITANDYLRKHPKVLSDEEVIDEIKNNPDSLTGRQLQRRIDALPKDPEKYDF